MQLGQALGDGEAEARAAFGRLVGERALTEVPEHARNLVSGMPGPVSFTLNDWPPVPVRAILEGDRVYVHFGSYGTACLRRDGGVLWRTQELKYSQVHGPGGSPVLYEDLLILNCDGNDTQFVAALDKNTGKVVWRKPRPSAMAYSTPQIIQAAGGPQLVSTGAFHAISYNPRTGEELWSVSYGSGFSNVPRPVFGDGLVYLCTGFYQPELLAVRVDGKGDVTASRVAWKYTRGVPLTSSPILVDGQVYMVADNGIATGLDAKTGQEYWRHRLGDSFGVPHLRRRQDLLPW